MLFKNDYIKSLEENIDDFLEVRDSLVSNNYIEIIGDNIDEISKKRVEINEKYQKDLAKYKEDILEYEDELIKYISKINSLEALSSEEKILYENLFKTQKSIILNDYKKFDKIVSLLNKELEKKCEIKVSNSNKTINSLQSSIINYVSIILWMAAFLVIDDLDGSFYFLYYVYVALIIISLISSIFGNRKNIYADLLNNQVALFKEKVSNNTHEVSEANYYKYLGLSYIIGIDQLFVNSTKNTINDWPINYSNLINDSITNSICLYKEK